MAKAVRATSVDPDVEALSDEADTLKRESALLVSRLAKQMGSREGQTPVNMSQ